MRRIETDRIEIDGISYPLYCNLHTLEFIQDKFKSVNAFERALLGLEVQHDENGEAVRDDAGNILMYSGEPKAAAISYGLYVMIKEGQRIEEMQDGIVPEEISEEYLSDVCDIPFSQVANKLHLTFNRCFGVKKNAIQSKTSRKKSTQK